MAITKIQSHGIASCSAEKITGLELGQVDTPATLTTNKTVPVNTNSLMVGDVALQSGVILTIENNSTLTIF